MEPIEIVANLMALSARTAPKGFGQDFLEIRVITGEKILLLADEMKKCAAETGRKGFLTDAKSLERSSFVILIGLKEAPSAGLNCGACGFLNCAEMEVSKRTETHFKGPQCLIRVTDLGIAIGSAVSTAAIHHADNRVMLNVGIAARRLKISQANYAFGIPLSDSSKSPYFDREPKG